MAGITSQTGVYPLDTIRTRMTTTPGVYSCVLGHPAKQFRQEDDCCRTFRRAVYHPAWKSNKESPNRKPKAMRAIARLALAFTSHGPPRACQSDWNVGHPSVSSPVSVSWSLSQPPFFCVRFKFCLFCSNSVYSVYSVQMHGGCVCSRQGSLRRNQNSLQDRGMAGALQRSVPG